jgi:hypothetical protein
MEFIAYGLLYSAVVTPRQLAIDLRGVPSFASDHPYVRHALKVQTAPGHQPFSGIVCCRPLEGPLSMESNALRIYVPLPA